jgi:ABC-type phosphate transport system substrate-binding protein
MRNLKIAAAVALAIGGVSAAQAATPTLAQCAAPGASLYVAGSSAAQPAFANSLAGDLYGGTANLLTFSASNGNFRSYCGLAVTGNGAGLAANTVVNVFYRAEGGSVVGALPIVNNKQIKFLDLTLPGCDVLAPATTGTSLTVGTTDGWGGCVSSHAVELGVTDLEPSVFTGDNYPTAYSTAVFGPVVSLASANKTRLFDQVFGIYVNTSGINGGGTGQVLNLSKATVGQILAGNYTDWISVPSATGAPVSSVSAPITVVNREAGSGTRTGASIYFLGDNCSTSGGSIADANPANDGFATGDVLTTASGIPGSLTYASIDNSKANMTIVQLNGVTPSNLAAAAGQYDWWFEASATKGTVTSPNGTAISNWLLGGELQNLKTAPSAVDIMVIPSVGTNGVGKVPLTSFTDSHTIYLNPFTKGGNSCVVNATETN